MAAEEAGWGPAHGGRRKAVAEEPRPLPSACCVPRACLSRRRRLPASASQIGLAAFPQLSNHVATALALQC
ncbi:unnamed protein product [Gulo gulo]|uniref:Uncharacterized protein n=1 Tax=Gulo gulo TaxID=48420 RepID=A0A9X9Q7J0_GULGU|nr:unnamed protein product [Gulo gulo]